MYILLRLGFSFSKITDLRRTLTKTTPMVCFLQSSGRLCSLKQSQTTGAPAASCPRKVLRETICQSGVRHASSYPVGKHGALTQIYIPDINFTAGVAILLPSGELAHLRARRVRNGSDIKLFNGRGDTAIAVVQGQYAVVQTLQNKNLVPTSKSDIVSIPPIAASLPNLSQASNGMDPMSKEAMGTHAIIAAIKSPQRSDWLVEKLTELGVRTITFTSTRRTVMPTDNVERRMARWERVAVAAAKQSVRLDIPVISAVSWDDCVKNVIAHDAPFVLASNGCSFLAPTATDLVVRNQSALFVIGPEGGLSDVEISELSDAGAMQISLGSNRLRSETAAVVAASVIAQILEKDCSVHEDKSIGS